MASGLAAWTCHVCTARRGSILQLLRNCESLLLRSETLCYHVLRAGAGEQGDDRHDV